MYKLNLKVKLLIALILLITIVFPGCSQTNQIDKEIESMSNQQGKPFTTETLTFYYPSLLGGFGIKKDANMVFNEIERKAADLKVKLNFKDIPYTEFQQKTETAIESSEPVDAILFYKPDAVNDFTKLASKGELADISELIPKYAPNIAQMLSEYDQRCIEVNGKVVGLPSINPVVEGCVVSVREDFLEKYNISDIKTLDDYEVYLKTIKENEVNIVPGAVSGKPVLIFSQAYGYEVLDVSQNLIYKNDDPNMRVKAWEQTPEFKKAINLITNWHRNGYLAEGERIEDSNVASKVSSTLTFEYTINNFNNSFMTSDGIAMKSFILYPDIKMNRVVLSDQPHQMGAIAFNSHSPNIERALIFLDWVQKDQKNYELFLYGIEGKHYTIDNGELKFPKGMTFSNSGYFPWEGYETFINVKWDRRTGVSNNNSLKQIMDKSQYAPHEGFYPNYLKVQEEADSRASMLLSNIIDPLDKGTFMLENTDYIIERLKTAGTEEIVDEIQQQLDNWRSKIKQ